MFFLNFITTIRPFSSLSKKNFVTALLIADVALILSLAVVMVWGHYFDSFFITYSCNELFEYLKIWLSTRHCSISSSSFLCMVRIWRYLGLVRASEAVANATCWSRRRLDIPMKCAPRNTRVIILVYHVSA